MEKSDIITDMKKSLDVLLEWKKERTEDLDKDKHKDRLKGKADEDVCPNCGGDLLWVEENIVYCKKCEEYFEQKEEGEE